MISISLAEIFTIALIALIVFGPRRLPEVARRVGRMIRDLREVASDLRSALDAELGEASAGFDEVRHSLGTTLEPRATAGDQPAADPETDDE